HINELQQRLLKDDCYIPGYKNEDKRDLAKKARISASSCVPNREPEKVVNGITRIIEDEQNCWESSPLGKDGESLTFEWKKAETISEIQLVFDPNLTMEISPSVIPTILKRQRPGIPPELVRDYDIELSLGGKLVFFQSVTRNYQRLNRVAVNPSVKADKLVIRITVTNGHPPARIFEVRVY
ncbi:MAG: hypothetical protein LBS57_12075, partial [Treponema sp.]|nr:hypothetical protein [Treponema sp.]